MHYVFFTQNRAIMPLVLVLAWRRRHPNKDLNYVLVVSGSAGATITTSEVNPMAAEGNQLVAVGRCSKWN